MNTTPTLEMRVTVSGLLRGRDLAGGAVARLLPDALELATTHGPLTFPLASLDGMRTLGDAVELFLPSGDVLQLERAPELPALAAELARRACALPEMTLSLRALGSRRGGTGDEHHRFFEALLEARRAAERAPNLVALRAAFDAVALRATVVRQLHDVAAERYPHDPPERRALEAELVELAGGLLASLALLERVQRALAACDDAERFTRWREWSAALRRVFESADECWLALAPVLTEQRRASPRRWRRWLGLGVVMALAGTVIAPLITVGRA